MTQDVLARNNVRALGSGDQPVMFAHGFGSAQIMWRFVAPAFADAYRVILFDYVGAGESEHQAFDAERYRDLRGYAQDVLDICAALDLKDLIFVGHSVSGMIGLLASLQAPDRFERLIMIGASACYVNEPPDYVGGFERADVEQLLNMMEKNYAGWASFLAPIPWPCRTPTGPSWRASLKAASARPIRRSRAILPRLPSCATTVASWRAHRCRRSSSSRSRMRAARSSRCCRLPAGSSSTRISSPACGCKVAWTRCISCCAPAAARIWRYSSTPCGASAPGLW